MAMVMANMVTAMARISYKFIAAFSLASLGFVSGCQKDYSVTAEDAEEVVLDDSGFSKKDVDDLNTEENSSGFNVEFNAKKTHFIYSVSKKGIICSPRDYFSLVESSEMESGDFKPNSLYPRFAFEFASCGIISSEYTFAC